MAETMPIDYLRQIIVRELSLSDDRVMIANQKWQIPEDDALFLTLNYTSAAPISSRVKQDPATGMIEEINLVTSEIITVSVMSRNLEAMRRKEDVAMSLVSTYSQQIQERYGFKIMRLSPIQNLSFLEASAMLQRFDIVVNVRGAYSKTKSIEYYETFTGEVHIDGNPEIVHEFEPPETV